MAGFNKMIAMGNLTKDPVLRTIPSGAQVCDMALATNRTFLVGGEKREETCFIDVAVWGKQGEACGKFLTEGPAGPDRGAARPPAVGEGRREALQAHHHRGARAVPGGAQGGAGRGGDPGCQ